MTELEEQILDLLVAKTGVERDRIELDSALAQDFGMDGDDAVEFFLQFAEDFHVDLAPLTPHWHEHFRSEGCLFLAPKGCMVVTGSSFIAGFIIHLAFNPIPAWAAIIGLIVVLGWLCRKVFNYYVDEEKSRLRSGIWSMPPLLDGR